MVYHTHNELVLGVYKPTNITVGGGQIAVTRRDWQLEYKNLSECR